MDEARRCQNEREDGITPHESSRSVISPCADVHVLVAAAAALQTLCGLGCLEKEGKIVTYAKQAAARTTRRRRTGTSHPQKQPKKSRIFFHGVKWRRDCLDTTDGRKEAETNAQAQTCGFCNGEEMPAEKSSLTECGRGRGHLDPFAR